MDKTLKTFSCPPTRGSVPLSRRSTADSHWTSLQVAPPQPAKVRLSSDSTADHPSSSTGAAPFTAASTVRLSARTAAGARTPSTAACHRHGALLPSRRCLPCRCEPHQAAGTGRTPPPGRTVDRTSAPPARPPTGVFDPAAAGGMDRCVGTCPRSPGQLSCWLGRSQERQASDLGHRGCTGAAEARTAGGSVRV